MQEDVNTVTFREVCVRRKEDVDQYLPERYREQIVKKIGSTLKNSAPHTGLTGDEEKEFLPAIIGFQPEDATFGERKRLFWAEKVLDVPLQGAVLNISTDQDGHPVNPKDWVTYKWVIANPTVAMDKDTCESDMRFQFYIHDPAKAERKELAELEIRKRAQQKFIEINEDPAIVATILRLLSNDNVDVITDERRLLMLDQMVINNPSRFLEIAENKNLIVKSFLAKGVQYGVITKIGSNYSYVDQTLGHTEEDAVNFLLNQNNSRIKLEVREKIKTAMQSSALA